MGQVRLFLQELSYRAERGNRFSAVVARTLLGIVMAAVLAVLCAPALVAFGIAGRSEERRGFMETFGVIWLLVILGLTALTMVVLIMAGLTRYFRTKLAIRRYARTRQTGVDRFQKRGRF